MEKIRTAVIGCGKVGHTHAAALHLLPESEFVAVCSRDPNRTRFFAERYSVRPYTNVRQMIAELDVQTVAVATPHPVHAGPAVEALDSRCACAG